MINQLIVKVICRSINNENAHLLQPYMQKLLHKVAFRVNVLYNEAWGINYIEICLLLKVRNANIKTNFFFFFKNKAKPKLEQGLKKNACTCSDCLWTDSFFVFLLCLSVNSQLQRWAADTKNFCRLLHSDFLECIFIQTTSYTSGTPVFPYRKKIENHSLCCDVLSKHKLQLLLKHTRCSSVLT